jgi:hypothetical protein
MEKTIDDYIKDSKDISDVMDIRPPVEHQGDQTNLDDLAGRKIVILDFNLSPSTLDTAKPGDMYAAVNAIDVEKKSRIWFNTSSKYVQEKLDEIKTHLPIQCIVEKGKSQKGMKYFNLIPAKAQDEVPLIVYGQKRMGMSFYPWRRCHG